jgi:hypothetical protein
LLRNSAEPWGRNLNFFDPAISRLAIAVKMKIITIIQNCSKIGARENRNIELLLNQQPCSLDTCTQTGIEFFQGSRRNSP